MTDEQLHIRSMTNDVKDEARSAIETAAQQIWISLRFKSEPTQGCVILYCKRCGSGRVAPNPQCGECGDTVYEAV